MSESDNHLFDELPFWGICPECGSEVTFYDTDKNKQGGRYKCTNCSRDTVWKIGKALNIKDVIKLVGEN